MQSGDKRNASTMVPVHNALSFLVLLTLLIYVHVSQVYCTLTPAFFHRYTQINTD